MRTLFPGVHFTRMIQGGVAGPNAVLAFAREGYKLTNFDSREMLDILLFSGLWRFLSKYPAMACSELIQSFSKAHFCQALTTAGAGHPHH